MLLTEILGRPVRAHDGVSLGLVADVRVALTGPAAGPGSIAGAQVHGIVVCPRRASNFLGYERTGATGPWVLAAFFHWRARGSFLVLWADVEAVGSEVVLRPDAQRYDPRLPGRGR